MTEPGTGPAARSVGARQFALVAACFMLSGFAALLYQTVWLRQFSVILGTSEQALAVILATYMGGLAVGSALAARVVHRIRRPLLTYGLLEGGIALTALAVPLGLVVVRSLQAKLFGGAPEPQDAGSLPQVLFALASTFSLVLLPTAMMGATLPLLAKHVVRNNEKLGGQIAILYALNTGGAVAGTLTAAFLCLPALGLSRTTWIGVAANLLVFGLVCLMAKGFRRVSESVPAADDTEDPEPAGTAAPRNDPLESRYRLFIWLAAISGAVAFCYEIVFTRMLGHILGGSIFAFATMLAGFLLGITIGSAIAARFARTRAMAATGFAYAQCAAALCSLVAWRTVDWMASWPASEALGGTSLPEYVSSAILALLPTAICIGATFPLAIRVMARDETEAPRAAARVYAWNTVGGITGALLTGAFILPRLDYEGTASLAIMANLTLGVLAFAVVHARPRHLAVAVAALVAVIALLPSFPTHVFHRSALVGHPIEGNLVFSKVGRSATVATFDQRGHFQVRTNGLPEATVVPKGSTRASQGSAVWLAALPPLVRPGGESMLIVGLGGGIAAANAPPSIKRIDVFELEPAVVEANRLIGPHRDNDPMADPRVSMILNDGRNGLHLTTKKYDYIVSQPSHPWTAGASHLFTREFAAIAREHLVPDGVFLQWMSTEFVDLPLLRSMTATLLDVFPEVRMYSPAIGELLFVAANEPLQPERVPDAARFLPAGNQRFYRELGMRTPSDLYAALRLDLSAARELAGDAPLITDDHNLFAFERSSSRIDAVIDGVTQALAGLRPIMRSHDVALAQCPTLDLAAVLKLRTWDFSDAEIAQLTERLDDPVAQVIRMAANLKSSGDRDGWARALADACLRFPDDPRPAFILLSDHFMGTKYPLTVDQMRELGTHLDERSTRLIEAIAAGTREHLSVVQEREPVLAAVPPDDPAFAYASRLRCYWRIKLGGPESVRQAEEAIAIAEADGPYVDAHGMAWFRTAAGIIAGRPLVALASTQELAAAVQRILDGEDAASQATLTEMVKTLAFCRQEIDDHGRLPGVSEKRYLEVRRQVDEVLARCGMDPGGG